MKPESVIGGRYVIERLAGSGGMGAVFRAFDTVARKPVALKILRGLGPETLARFQREAQLLETLRSPGIVGYDGFGTSDEGDVYMVLEWLEGETLKERIERAPMSLRESIELVAGIAEALAPAHDRGVVHRDLKPANIFLIGGSVRAVKVLDFGIARVLGGDFKLTMTGAVLGTPGFMAPEQIRGDRELDVRCDVYAMGCILFRAVSGRAPFEAKEAVALLMKTATEAAPHLKDVRPGVPDRLDALVAGMLKANQEERPSNARVVAAELRALATTVREESGAASIGSASAPLAVDARFASSASSVPSFVSSPSTVAIARAPTPVPPAAAAAPAKRSALFFAGIAALVLVFAAAVVGGVFLVRRDAKRASKTSSTATSSGRPTASAPAPPVVAPTAFTFAVAAPKTAALAPYRTLFSHGRFKTLVDVFGGNLVLSKTVEVRAQECGAPDARFEAASRRIVLCFELAQLIRDRVGLLPGSDQEKSDITIDALSFLTLHMMGHALVAEGVAVTGDEEVAVDELATLSTIDMKHPEWTVGSAKALIALDDMDQVMFAGAHGPTGDRIRDLLCIVYGSAPEAQRDLLSPSLLPPERAEGCKAVYQQRDKSWTSLLAPVVRAKEAGKRP